MGSRICAEDDDDLHHGDQQCGVHVRHVAAAASKAREVDAGTTAGGAKRTCCSKHSVGEPGREVCTDQRCGKCSPGFSDTLGVQVRPVGVYVSNVVLLRL